MNGMNANTGKRLSKLDHLRQSISDILTTPIGSRVMRREYGSRLYRIIDAPINRSTLLDIYAATAEAIMLWEPRIKLLQVSAQSASSGHVVLEITGEYLQDGQAVKFYGIEVV